MIVVLFRSRLTGAAGEDYRATDAHLAERARTAPGFVDVKAYTAEDGERLTIVRWRDLETLKKWREDPEHRAAQAAGRAAVVRALRAGSRRGRAREPLRAPGRRGGVTWTPASSRTPSTSSPRP